MVTETRSTNFIHPLDHRHPDHEHYKARLLAEANRQAGGEPVTAVMVNDDRSWYAFTTELGMYRLADKYGRVSSKGWSRNRNTWFVCIGGTV